MGTILWNTLLKESLLLGCSMFYSHYDFDYAVAKQEVDWSLQNSFKTFSDTKNFNYTRLKALGFSFISV